jgi:hypothetical protein
MISRRMMRKVRRIVEPWTLDPEKVVARLVEHPNQRAVVEIGNFGGERRIYIERGRVQVPDDPYSSLRLTPSKYLDRYELHVDGIAGFDGPGWAIGLNPQHRSYSTFAELWDDLMGYHH